MSSDKPVVVTAMNEKRRFASIGDAEFWMRTNLPYNEAAVAIDTRRKGAERTAYVWNTSVVPHVLEHAFSATKSAPSTP